jgi:hypothetical protein
MPQLWPILQAEICKTSAWLNFKIVATFCFQVDMKDVNISLSTNSRSQKLGIANKSVMW